LRIFDHAHLEAAVFLKEFLQSGRSLTPKVPGIVDPCHEKNASSLVRPSHVGEGVARMGRPGGEKRDGGDP
jgi:hypothetical protein